MKNTIIAIVVAAILVGGYVVYSRNQGETSAPMPNQNSNAKININEVCEGTLAYMTFENGEQAEKFVQECKEGKHPQVIEQYKANLNLDAGVEI
jgi:hypothetical protein